MTEEERQKQREHAAKVAAEVETWPKWKRNLLRDSLKPSWDKPRPPVFDPDDCY